MGLTAVWCARPQVSSAFGRCRAKFWYALGMEDRRQLWIALPGDQDSPELERATRRYRKEERPVPTVVAAMKPSAKALSNVLRMNYAVSFGGSSLGRRREELIAASVSALNECFY